MAVQKYLEDKLKNCSKYELTNEDKKYIKENSLKEFLFKQISRKKFRRWKLPDPAKKRIKKALDVCLAENKPIIFRFRFGGYKLWSFPTTPEVDWAEFLMLCHYCAYLSPLAAAYKPGVKFYFNSDDEFVERLNNIPKSHTDAYYKSFQKLLDEFRKYFPDNLEIDVIRHRSLFDSQEEFEKQFQEQVDRFKDTWKENRSPEELQRDINTSIMNIKWDGVEDLTKLSEEEKQAKIEQSIMYHDALIYLRNIRTWSDTPDKIPIFTTSYPGVVAIGVTKTSAVRFWVGTGLLQKKNDSYADHVLSITQYESIKDMPFQEEKINLIPLKNFATIRVYENTLNFANKS